MSIENDRPLKDVQYILFKNAANVNGVVTRNDVICEWPVRDREKPHYSPRYPIVITWNFPIEKMDLVLKGLRTQLDADYEVLRRLPFLVARDFSLGLHGAHSTGVLVRPHQTAEKSASILVNFSKCDCEKRAMATPPLSFLLSNFEAPELGCKLMN